MFLPREVQDAIKASLFTERVVILIDIENVAGGIDPIFTQIGKFLAMACAPW